MRGVGALLTAARVPRPVRRATIHHDVLDARAIIVFDNITGTVTGNVTQGDKSIDCSDELPTAYPFA